MTEELVSFETAKLAKEKGFKHNSKCYGGNGEILENIENHNNNIMQRFRYAAPTQSLLQKWLRKKHNIHIWLIPSEIDKTYRAYVGYGIKLDLLENSFTQSFETYEETLEKGLQEALKLI